MPFQINPYAGLLVVSALLSAALAVAAWRRRPTPGAGTLAALMLALAFWSAFDAIELLSTSLTAKLFWERLEYPFVLASPALWLIFVLQFTGREHWVTPVTLAGAAVVPIVSFVLIYTTPGLAWLYPAITVEVRGSLSVLAVTRGPLFWLLAIYSYVLVLLAVGLTVHAFLRGGPLQRVQNGAILVAALAPVVGNIIYNAGFSPLRHVDPAPVLFIVTGMVSVWALTRYRLLDLLPIARDALIESMIDGVAVVDIHGRVVDLNKAAQQMIGQRVLGVLGAPAVSVLPAWPELSQQSLTEHPVRTQMKIGDQDSLLYYDLRISPLLRADGAAQGWLAVFRDDTARVRAEQAERQQRDLAESLRNALATLTSTLSLEEVLDRILELTDAVAPHDASNIMLIDHGMAKVRRIRGYPSGAMEPIINLSLSVQETPNLRRMAETLQPLAIADTAEDAGWIVPPGVEWARSYAAAPIISKGEVLGFLNLDSTQPRVLNQQHAETLQAFADQAGIALENAHLYTSLQESNAKLSRALRAREEAIQNVSHELRTPLTLMLGYVEFMQSGGMGPVNSDQAGALHIVAQQGKRLQFIFNSLLTLQNFQQKELFTSQLDTRAWLVSTLAIWQQLAVDAGLTVSVEIPDQLSPIMGAAGYLDLALGNLMDNAIKFSSKGQRITVSAHDADDVVIISVADQGIGISSEQLDMIFDRFYQVDSTSTRRHGGMGIGLALCQAIIQAHGGRIWGESEGPDQGSTFIMTLPIAPPLPGS
ncbi:MAG TPA: histidine kinase N-terminal 7TM domain-containing protein [Anaerolineae bacterium]|nr:histidine kinase N-terminal 7TM domain-containing protein [Anaerolineae bacterium]HNU02918.1 histidine kinase N-terminal 7TM domain-containing protein [Anaerolineae bacterium]